MMTPTVPAPSESQTGAIVPGTIGFELYVSALRVQPSALKAPKVPSAAPGFYVSCIDGVRRALVAGPFETHQEALDQVEPQRESWYERDARSWFHAWGTARVRADEEKT